MLWEGQGPVREIRLPALALVLGLLALGVAVVFVIDSGGEPAPTDPPQSAGGSGAATPEPAAGIVAVEASAAGPDFTVDGGRAPTDVTSQSKLWFHDGAWWGVLLAQGTDELRIHRFDWSGQRWVDTNVRVATRSSMAPDVLVEGDLLWITTGGGQPTPRRTAALFRYTYDAESGRYALDHDFPVTIADERARSMTLARDDAGRLWAAWASDERLFVSHTNGNDWSWEPGDRPPVAGAGVVPDALALVAYGDSVALVWTNEAIDTLFVAAPSLDDPASWQQFTVDVEGLAPGDDHLSVAVAETPAGPRLLVAVQTSLDELPDSSQNDPQLLLVAIEPDGSTRQYLVGRISDGLARPVLLIDGENEVMYVLATSPTSGGRIVFKASPIDDIGFPQGEGFPLIDVEGVASITSATSTKQTLGSRSGLVVLASDGDAGRYAWVAGRLPGDGAPDMEAVPEPVPDDAALVNDTFDPFEPGRLVDPMWATRSTGGAAFAIADTEDGRRVAAASAAADGSNVRICREFAPVADGMVRIEADVMVSRVGLSDVTVTSVRHGDDQTAVVRMDDRGVFSFFDGATEVRSEVRYATGVWYTSVVDLDLDSRLYNWRVVRDSDGATVLTVDRARWRAAATGPATDVCLESAEATNAATVFSVDRVRVER
jgi:hypothetical protein